MIITFIYYLLCLNCRFLTVAMGVSNHFHKIHHWLKERLVTMVWLLNRHCYKCLFLEILSLMYCHL